MYCSASESRTEDGDGRRHSSESSERRLETRRKIEEQRSDACPKWKRDLVRRHFGLEPLPEEENRGDDRRRQAGSHALAGINESEIAGGWKRWYHEQQDDVDDRGSRQLGARRKEKQPSKEQEIPEIRWRTTDGREQREPSDGMRKQRIWMTEDRQITSEDSRQTGEVGRVNKEGEEVERKRKDVLGENGEIGERSDVDEEPSDGRDRTDERTQRRREEREREQKAWTAEWMQRNQEIMRRRREQWRTIAEGRDERETGDEITGGTERTMMIKRSDKEIQRTETNGMTGENGRKVEGEDEHQMSRETKWIWDNMRSDGQGRDIDAWLKRLGKEISDERNRLYRLQKEEAEREEEMGAAERTKRETLNGMRKNTEAHQRERKSEKSTNDEKDENNNGRDTPNTHETTRRLKIDRSKPFSFFPEDEVEDDGTRERTQRQKSRATEEGQRLADTPEMTKAIKTLERNPTGGNGETRNRNEPQEQGGGEQPKREPDPLRRWTGGTTRRPKLDGNKPLSSIPGEETGDNGTWEGAQRQRGQATEEAVEERQRLLEPSAGEEKDRKREREVCRYFTNNTCKFGRNCEYSHPQDKMQFCHDFQNSFCKRKACKFIHVSSDVEIQFRKTGNLPIEAEDQIIRRGIVFNPTGDDNGNSKVSETRERREAKPSDDVRFCHDYQNAHCSRDPCKFIHAGPDAEWRYKETGYLSQKAREQAIEKGMMKEHLIDTEQNESEGRRGHGGSTRPSDSDEISGRRSESRGRRQTKEEKRN